MSAETVEDVQIVETSENGDVNDDTEHSVSSSQEIEELVSCQTDEKENSFYNTLLHGFQSLQEAREGRKTPLFATQGPQGEPKPINSFVTVNFIDPTTKPPTSPTATSKSTNMLSRQSVTVQPPIENVYDKLTLIFKRDFGSTLRSVQYKNMRTGENDCIGGIPVQTILTRAGGLTSNGESANVAWGGMAGTAMVSDPSEWHNGPFCHVYIAAIDNMEHYRSKLRPSLKAFVSQIESAASLSTATPSDQGSGVAHFLIVYVPTGTKDGLGHEEAIVGSGPVRRALASQFQKARERIANYNQDQNLDNSQHSKDSLGSNDGELVYDDSEHGTVALNLLSQHERAVYQKIASDFSNGKVCVLSKTSLEDNGDDLDSDAGVATRAQEWNSFTKMLGSVIVNGFKDRCRRYNEELKRLDIQRATAAQQAANDKSKSKTPATAFNLTYFFLVKESLAFTYEQMQLPSEALLQYDEFRAFLPDLTARELKKALRARRKNKSLSEEEPPARLSELADAGDCMDFRRSIRSEFDLNPILDIMRRYLFARELSLLFKMERPVEVIARCEIFCKLMYVVMMRGVSELGPEEQHRRRVEAAKWVIQFAWDVKSTCENFLLSVAEVTRESLVDTVSVDTPSSDLLSESSQSGQSEQNIASRLGELLEMSRLLMKELGDTELTGENPLRTYERKLPDDMFRPWQPWTPVDPSETKDDESQKFGRVSKAFDRQLLLDEAFSTPERYEQTYLDLAGAIVNLSRYGHRRRIASRLQGEIAEHHVRKKDFKAAAAVFKSIVKQYRWDHWDRCHFWRLFRLSFCQRVTSSATEYLKTLATCFSPRTTAVAPKKALEALQSDLELVIGHPDIGASKYGTIAFMETSLQILSTSSDETSVGPGVDNKQTLKRYCSVGEKVQVSAKVTSFLPSAIELSSLKLFIVDFESFSSIIENRESVEEEDAIKIIGIDSAVKVEPGTNSYTFDWEPSSAGQFILSTLEVVWKHGFFYYDSMELSAPLLCLEVLPSEPTQTISFDPGYLVPGHDQEVRITFDAGADLVTAGKVELSCSDGITLIVPGEDPMEGNWKKECEVPLSSCKPGEKRVLTTHVRCGHLETFTDGGSISQTPSFDTTHGLRLQASTTYLHATSADADHSDTPNMRTTLEVFAPILEKSALSVESTRAVWLTPGERALLSINLMSNTPGHFSVEEWSLDLPAPLKLVEGVDHNGDLLSSAVSDGDQLALAFECSVSASTDSSNSDPLLQVKLRDDMDKLFSLDLSLDLKDFYEGIPKANGRKAMSDAKASLNLAASEGNVGEPVKMTFTVETEASGDIAYSIVSDGCDWILGGKVNGIMQRSGFMSLGFFGTCEVLGVPTTAGPISTFPKIVVGTASLKGEVVPLNVKFTPPPAFRAISRTSEVGVGFPINKIAI